MSKSSCLLSVMVLVVVLSFAVRATAQESPGFIGINLEGTQDWQRQYLFADAMRQSRGWGSPAAPWDLSAAVDVNGWPTGDAGVVVLTNGAGIAGTYRLSFSGPATVASLDRLVAVRNLTYDVSIGASRADVVVDPAARGIMLSFTGTHGGVRNVRLIRPGYDRETFTRPFLDLIRPFSCLRFMQYAATNGNWTPATGNLVAEWSDRTLPSYATQNRSIQGIAAGAAWEFAIELANLTDKDVWVNVPDLASDDYVRRLAQLLRDGLEPGRNVYVEFSNEVWNWGYASTARNFAAAQAEVAAGRSPLNYDGSTNAGFLAWRRVAMRIRAISEIFRSVFGDAAMMTRVRPVLAGQSGQPETIRQGLEFIERVYGPPSRALYAVSGAPYFGIPNDMSARMDLTVDQIFAAMPASLDGNFQAVTQFSAWARYYRLRNVAYEGGPSLVGAASLVAKIAATRDPRMGDAILRCLRDYRAAGGDEFMYYTSVGAYSQYGMFGLTDDLAQLDTVQTRAIAQVLAEPRPALAVGLAVPGVVEASNPIARNWLGSMGTAPDGARYYSATVAGGWNNYLIRVPSSGSYRFSARVAANAAGGRFEMLIDSLSPGATAVPATGGLTHWVDLSMGSLSLSEGLHVIRIRVASPGFYLQSIGIAR